MSKTAPICGIEIIKNGEPKARILADRSNSMDMQAAELLQDFTRRITGAKPEIISAESTPEKGDILIGNFQLPIEGINSSDITEDGFALTTHDGYIRIVHGIGKGSIYGIVTLLEEYFGIHYYAADTYTIHKNKNMQIPAGIKRIENPSFRYRQTQSYSFTDPVYKMWHRLEEPEEVFVQNLWVHTFNSLLPASEFGDSHPEYYAYINGERRPGDASQWCLTNPEVFEIVAARLDKLFKANPDKHLISVSQNDSQNYCACDECRAIDEYEGSPSGSLIRFMNKLAERFPDKEISTLAYLYSVPPPRHTKPLPNVTVMLCDINCNREVPLTDNDSGREFIQYLEGWAAISDNIFVWDYGINFDNYVSPFPNFHILQPNMELFRRNNVSMHFSQIAGSRGGDFSELRTYLAAKLLWNVSADVDSLIKTFLDEYYGKKSAPYLYEYIKLREEKLIESGKNLWIYDTPITHKDGMLNRHMIARYKELFDQAEQAAAGEGEPPFLSRVRTARLPVMYAELEIARTEPEKDNSYLSGLLNLFRDRAAEYGITVLNERNNTIAEYCDTYRQRNISDRRNNLALGCPVTFIQPADSPYDKIAGTALTDGLYGGAVFNESWVGWEGRDAEFVIDLGRVREIQTVEMDFLHQLGSWILLPKRISCSVSTDGQKYQFMGQKDIPEDRETQVKFVDLSISADTKLQGQYIQVKIETIGLCPPWHNGVGYPAWFFLDEVHIY